MLDIVMERKVKGEKIQLIEFVNNNQLLNLKSPTILLVNGNNLNRTDEQILYSILKGEKKYHLPDGSIIVFSGSEYLRNSGFHDCLFHYKFPNQPIANTNPSIMETISRITESSILSLQEKLALIGSLKLSETTR
jgi:hypothetical protein